MALSIGIVGLPNVGKSTLFNALTKTQAAQAANYPFCTIEPNKATVAVPDERLETLAKMANPQKKTPATVDFIDIAGLVRGASKGEGLGNQFLGNIRDCSAILEVVRCFNDENIVHVDGKIDPLNDIDAIETEMLLADLQTVEKRLEKIKKMAKGNRDAAANSDLLEQLLKHLNAGLPARAFPLADTLISSMPDLALLTSKPIIYCANVDDADLENSNARLEEIKAHAKRRNSELAIICAKLEEELVGLPEEEQREMLSGFGVQKSGLERIIQLGYQTLGLQSYFTVGPKEVRAWTFSRGWKAPACAGIIHSDFEKGFIRAEVIGYDDYIRHGSETACRASGCLRTEGRDYIMQDGDVVEFLFNV